MKKAVIVFFLWCHCHNLFGQLIPCDKLPTSKDLIQRLSVKPVNPGYLYEYQEGCNITDSLKSRILYLLNWRWTKDEINTYLKNDLEKHKHIYRVDAKALSISKGNDSVYKVSLDSIVNVLKAETLNEMEQLSLFSIPNNLILVSAKLDIKKAIPVLHKGLADAEHYDSANTELALARLGDKLLQRKIITTCNFPKNDDFDFKAIYFSQIAPKLLFVSTQESIFKLSEWLDTKMLYSTISGDKPNTKCAYIVIADLKKIIENEDFQKETRNLPIDWASANGRIDNGPILFCKNWLIKNKGKYKINKNYTPYY